MISKEQLRRVARAKRVTLAVALPEYAQTIAAYAADIPLRPRSPVASYWPLQDEADPRLLALALGLLQHPVLLPRVDVRDARLSFRLWRKGDPLHLGAFGQMEPLEGAAIVEPDTVLVPLLAFDAAGHRLGYGGGYYDRTLSELRARRHVLAVGIAYAGQEVEMSLHAPHDERLDMVLTENGLRRFDGADS